jgi:hypothetical protein
VNDALDLSDFDRYVKEHGIPEEDYPAAFAPVDRRADGLPACVSVIT